jgi:hypothetical protein
MALIKGRRRKNNKRERSQGKGKTKEFPIHHSKRKE